MEIRVYSPSDLQEVLSLIRRSNSTDRTEETWRKNAMTGVLAFDRGKLIGAIPLEPRIFDLGDGESLRLLWVSAAHVDPEYRSRGVGGRLDVKIREVFFPDYKAIFVYRDDENSPAYRWYARLGYQLLLPILAFKIQVFPVGACLNYNCWTSTDQIKSIERELFDCFQRNCRHFGGGPRRHPTFWSERIDAHYYRRFYKYLVVTIPQDHRVKGYAILGETDMRDKVKRLDILEHCAPDDPQAREELFLAIMQLAYNRNLAEVRVQMSPQDPGICWVQKFGFENRWRTNLMGVLMRPIEYLRDQVFSVADIEGRYKITVETPVIGRQSIGNGNRELGLFMSDAELTRLLLKRTNMRTAVEEGRIVVTKYEEEALGLLDSLLRARQWQFHQIDYV